MESCLHQSCHLSPFLLSVDGLLGVEVYATLKHIASRLAKKWKQPYSLMCSYIKIRVATTMVRVTHRCIQGSLVTAHKIGVQRLQLDDGDGLNLSL